MNFVKQKALGGRLENVAPRSWRENTLGRSPASDFSYLVSTSFVLSKILAWGLSEVEVLIQSNTSYYW